MGHTNFSPPRPEDKLQESREPLALFTANAHLWGPHEPSEPRWSHEWDQECRDRRVWAGRVGSVTPRGNICRKWAESSEKMLSSTT